MAKEGQNSVRIFPSRALAQLLLPLLFQLFFTSPCVCQRDDSTEGESLPVFTGLATLTVRPAYWFHHQRNHRVLPLNPTAKARKMVVARLPGPGYQVTLSGRTQGSSFKFLSRAVISMIRVDLKCHVINA